MTSAYLTASDGRDTIWKARSWYALPQIFLQKSKVILSEAKNLAAALFAAVRIISLANVSNHAAKKAARDPRPVLRTCLARTKELAQDDLDSVNLLMGHHTSGLNLSLGPRWDRCFEGLLTRSGGAQS